MCNFSQGPWSTTFNGSWYELSDANENWVADTCASSCRGNIELGKSNAHLIAAAPEMYALIETYMGGHPEAEKLLAKARGENA